MAKNSFKLKSLLLLLVISIIVILSVKYIFPYFITFIFAYWLAKCAIPIAFFLHEKLRFPRTMSNIITLTLILIVLGTVLYFLTDSLINQLNLLIENFPSYRLNIQSGINNICSCFDNFFKLNAGTSISYTFSYIDSLFQKGGTIFSGLTRQTVALMFQTIRFFIQFGIVVLSAILIMQDHGRLKEMYHSWFLYDDVEQILKQLSKTGLTYMKMQFIIMSVIAVQCTLGLFLSKSSYPLLLGILIAIFDALPLLGSGTILVPWAIIKLFSNNIIGAAILMSTYLICQITRQFLESKLLGDTLGLAPIYFVMSLFIGIEFYGVTGVVLGPFSVLLIKTIYGLYKPVTKESQHE